MWPSQAAEGCTVMLQAKWCTKSDPSKTPPTAVLVHGILGNKRNLKSFTRMLLEVPNPVRFRSTSIVASSTVFVKDLRLTLLRYSNIYQLELC